MKLDFFGFDPDSKNCGVCYIKLKQSNGKVQISELVPSHISHSLDLSGDRAVLAMIEKLAKDHPAWGYGKSSGPVIVSERMEAYTHKREAAPNLLMLEQVSGAWQGIWKALYPDCELIWTLPKEWKGTVPKKIHHKRIINKLGLSARLAPRSDSKYYIDEWPHLKPAQNYHILDAVGLALFGIQKTWKSAFVFST